MIERTRHSHTNFEMFVPYADKADAMGGAIRCKSGGFMDLSIENLHYSDPYGNPVYSMTHYGEQNGDLMTLSVNRADGRIIPLSFRNDYMGVYQEVIQLRKGKQMYSVSLLKELDDFLWQWLKNIDAQGFTPDSIETI